MTLPIWLVIITKDNYYYIVNVWGSKGKLVFRYDIFMMTNSSGNSVSASLPSVPWRYWCVSVLIYFTQTTVLWDFCTMIFYDTNWQRLRFNFDFSSFFAHNFSPLICFQPATANDDEQTVIKTPTLQSYHLHLLEIDHFVAQNKSEIEPKNDFSFLHS